jgi:carboxylesterase type B
MTVLNKYTQLVATSFETPVTFLGVLLKQGKVEQYRGIKFGTLTSRWAEATICSNYKTKKPTPSPKLLQIAEVLQTKLSSVVYDATQFGPLCPQPPEDVTGYYAVPRAIEKPIPASATPHELELLNLVITRPAPDFTSDSRSRSSQQKKEEENLVPVVIFIHGGSNATGGAANPLYDGSTLVERSVEMSKPVVLVHIQYRLGALGWLYVDGCGNRALRDQLTALHWVKKHIKDFGGDPNNISVLGLSAGSCDTFYQVLFQEQQRLKQLQAGANANDKKLFGKIALMSGVADTMPFRSVKSQIATKREIAVNIFGKEKVANAEFENKLDDLLKKVPIDELVLKSGFSGPSGDEIRIWYGTIEENDGGAVAATLGNTTTLPDWIDGALMCDTGEEGLLFSAGVKHLDPAKTMAAFRSLDNTEHGANGFGTEIINSYNLESDFIKGIEALFADLLFTYPMYRTQKENVDPSTTNNCNIYRLYFDALNPFDPREGSMHGVDMLYLFGSYLHHYSPDSPVRRISRELQDTYLEFFHSGRAWANPAHVKRFASNETADSQLLNKGLERNFRRIDIFENLFDKRRKENVHGILRILSSL